MLLCLDLLVVLASEISARLLPEKLTIYTTLVGLLNARNYNFGGEFVEAMIRQLKESLKSNNYNEAVYLVSFWLFDFWEVLGVMNLVLEWRREVNYNQIIYRFS